MGRLEPQEIFLLLSYVNNHPGVTLSALSKKFKHSKREIKKALELASLCGLPDYTPFDLIEVDFEGEKVFLRFADYFERPLNLSVVEAVAILTAVKLIKKTGLPLVESLNSAVKKIKGALSGEFSQKIEEAAEGRMIVTEEVNPEILTKINYCLEKCLRAEMVYHTVSRDQISCRQIDPYLLILDKGKWYLMAYCHSRRNLRRFLVSHIKEFTPLSEKFERKNFSFADYVNLYSSSSLGGREVKLLYGPEVSDYIREILSPKVREDKPDGSCLVTLKASSFPGLLKKWVLPYGSHVKVLEPPELIALLKEKIRATAKIYQG